MLIAGEWYNYQSINPSIGIVFRCLLFKKEKFGIILDFIPRIDYLNDWDQATIESK
jgi:hypothetical protein